MRTRVENRWGRLEGFLSSQAKEALCQTVFKEGAKVVELRHISIECERLYPREKDYRQLAELIEAEVSTGKVQGSLEGSACISMLVGRKLCLISYLAFKKPRTRKPKVTEVVEKTDKKSQKKSVARKRPKIRSVK